MKGIRKWFSELPRPVAWIIAIGGTLFLMAFAVVTSATAWEYTNSPEFCGETCHTMPPEYTAYQVSPHARVACVDCHLGQKSFREAVPAKAREITHVTNALFNTYEPPIYIKTLRPARETCEQCHNPDKFSFDTFEKFSRFATDEENSESRYYMTFKTGGGTQEQGLGRGIHWHVENEVWYYADDPLKQSIPYIKEIGLDGTVVEYFDVEAGLPPDFGETVSAELRRMDCIDCHNRISHEFRSPDDAMDVALNLGQIDKTIPYIKEKGVEILSQEYVSAEAAYQEIESLDSWYAENYPDYYADNAAAIDEAIVAMKTIFDVTVFPNMEIGWQTHPNNVGHKEFPGCFRCHDGKHVSQENETIRLECNICHSIPEIVEPGQEAPVVTLERGDQPESHQDSNWLAMHRYVFDDTCEACHTVSDPGGTSNTSFCSNAACHGITWVYAGLDAPAISEMVAPPRTPSSGEAKPVPHPVTADSDCTICHGPEGVHPYPESHASFDRTMCTQCHVTGQQAAPAAPAATAEAPTPETEATKPATIGGPPAVPHPLQGRENCLMCHGEADVKPYPADHAGRPVTSCVNCHQTGASQAPEATSVPAATATTAPPATPVPAATATKAPTASSVPAATATSAATSAPAASPTGTPAEDATPEATESAESSGPAVIPHSIAGQEDQCLACHYTGSIKPFPANHEGFTNDVCLGCHQQGS